MASTTSRLGALMPMSRPQSAAFISLSVLTGVFAVYMTYAATFIREDVNKTGRVDTTDLSMLLSRWGTSDPACDINASGKVDIIDLSLMLSHWGAVADNPSPAPTLASTPTATPAPTPTDPANIHGWGLPSFRDEFNGIIDPRWNIRDRSTFGNLSYDFANIKAGNVTVRNGNLVISAKKETYGSGTRDITTGYVDTKGKYSTRYGRWEMRAKIPTLSTTPGTTRGMWPAFWLRNDSSGEIDIMEAWGTPTDAGRETTPNASSFTIHSDTNSSAGSISKGWTWERLNGQTTFSTPAAFHTWAIEYTPSSLKLYFDNRLVNTITPSAYPWVWGSSMNSPWHMRLNLQVGGGWHFTNFGTDKPTYPYTALPAEYLIDYVRVWEYRHD